MIFSCRIVIFLPCTCISILSLEICIPFPYTCSETLLIVMLHCYSLQLTLSGHWLKIDYHKLTVNSNADCSCTRCAHSIPGCTLILDQVISCPWSGYICNSQWNFLRQNDRAANFSPDNRWRRNTTGITNQGEVSTFNDSASLRNHLSNWGHWNKISQIWGKECIR